MWCSREMIRNPKSKLHVEQQPPDSMRTERIILLSLAQKPSVGASCLTGSQQSTVSHAGICPMVLGPLLPLGPWLEGAVVPFTWCVSLFFSGNQRCGDGREMSWCASSPSKVGFSQGAPMVQEFRRVFGLERTQQPIPGCSQPYTRTCRCIKSGTSLCVLTLRITPLVFRGAVLIPFHYIDLYLLVLLFITASNNLYHTMTVVGFNSSLPPWTCGGFIFFFYPCLCFLLQLIFPGYTVCHLFQPHISYFFFHWSSL